ncbi:MAG TPA: GNAT family N-acetyltransferase [Streptosporangiaceae bacterium]|jgi:ribosomal protein S18 acetylase RimI-like enzyme
MDPAISVFERMSAVHWRGIEREFLGDWLLRAAGGFTGRANSALPLGDPGMPAERAVAEVAAWYSQRGLPPMIAIVRGMRTGATALDDLLVRCGWSPRQIPVVVMTARAEAIARLRRNIGMTLAAEPDDEWLRLYRFRGQRLPAHARPVLLSAPEQTFASVRRNGHTVATGRLSLAGGWGGIAAVEVDPACRRAGLGTGVTAGLAAQAASRGAEWLFLQVEEENAAARALYARMGFTDHHRYHYRVGPA